MKGYVFRMRLVPGFFFILYYSPRNYVEMTQSEKTDIFSVCDDLEKRFGGTFVVADRDAEKWGRLVAAAQDCVVLK